MNPSSSESTRESGGRSAPVLMTLDASGRIQSSGENAALLWQTSAAALVGRPLVELFSFEITSNEPDWQEVQWEALLAIAAEDPLPLTTRASAPFEVELRLQPAHGAPAAYFAEIRPAPVPSAPPKVDAPSPSTLNPQRQTPISGPSALDSGLAADAVFAACGSLGLFDLDLKTGRATYAAGWKRLLGYADADLADTYDAWLALIHPEDTAAAPARIGKQTATHDFSVEFRMRHRLGHYLWVQCDGTRVFDGAGALVRVLGAIRDITAQKDLEEQNFVNEDRLERLCADGRLGLFDLDLTASTFWFSPACAALLGHAPGQLDASAFARALAPDAEGTDLSAFFNALAPGEPFVLHAQTLRPTEPSTSSPGLSALDSRLVLLGAHRQWSRRRELTRVVGFLLPAPTGGDSGPVSSIMLTALFAALREGVIVTDAQSRVVYLNAKAAQLTGWPLDEARKFKLGDVFRLVGRDDGKPDETAVDLVLATEESPRLYSGHALVTAAAATAPAPIVWTARQGWDDKGHPAGTLVIFRDPQEMSLSPEEIIRSNRFESLGHLSGGIAHDFNNLLTTILGGISQAKDNHDPSRLADAESACLAAKLLARQLLTFSKGSSSGSGQQVVAVADILNDAVRVAAAGSTAVVKVDASDTVAPIDVDRGQILQVFQNLIINAVQAMPDPSAGQVALTAANVTLAADDVPPLPAGPYVQIQVHDNGSGIPPEILAKIFEPFFTTKKQGTGLGLATVLAIVRKHGGQIGVDSTVGVGTTFTLFFPQASRPVEAPTRLPPTLRFGTGRVLFMDDDARICDLTAGMLSSLDYTYDIVKNGADAITFYKRYLNIGRPYDAVILDLNVVGGMGGEECFKALRDLHPEVRAIVSSGYDSDDMARRYYDMGFVGYLTKPYRAAELGKAIKSALGKQA